MDNLIYGSPLFCHVAGCGRQLYNPSIAFIKRRSHSYYQLYKRSNRSYRLPYLPVVSLCTRRASSSLGGSAANKEEQVEKDEEDEGIAQEMSTPLPSLVSEKIHNEIS